MAGTATLPQCVEVDVARDEAAENFVLTTVWVTKAFGERWYTTEMDTFTTEDIGEAGAGINALMRSHYDSAKDHFDPTFVTLVAETMGVDRYGFDNA